MRSIVVVVVMTLLACARPDRAGSPAAEDVRHGVRVADPHRWLEETGSPAVRAWLRAQDRAARAHLARLPGRDALRAEIAAVAAAERTLAPVRAGERSFFLRGDSSLTRSSLLMAQAGGEARVLVDGAEMAGRGLGLQLGVWPGPGGRRVAFAVGPPDSRTCELRVHDLALGRELADRIAGLHCAAPMAGWTSRGDGLVFVRAESGEVRMRPLGSGSERVLFAARGEITGLWTNASAHEIVVATLRAGRTSPAWAPSGAD